MRRLRATGTAGRTGASDDDPEDAALLPPEPEALPSADRGRLRDDGPRAAPEEEEEDEEDEEEEEEEEDDVEEEEEAETWEEERLPLRLPCFCAARL